MRSSDGSGGMCPRTAVAIIVLTAAVPATLAMRIARPWADKHWCESIEEPEWPMAYHKYKWQWVENKGRVNSNKQDMRHECGRFGAESKCHICEDIELRSRFRASNTDRDILDLNNGSIYYQLQGVAWENMAHNVPTVSDSPWAVGGRHRYDFGSGDTSRVCVMVSGGYCSAPHNATSATVQAWRMGPSIPWSGHAHIEPGRNFGNCTLRCWGYGKNFSGEVNYPTAHLEGKFYTPGQDNQDNYRTADFDSNLATDVWRYTKVMGEGTLSAEAGKMGYGGTLSAYGGYGVDGVAELDWNPQGYTYTLAGSSKYGYRDGEPNVAQFRAPQDITIDKDRNVFVADTENNCIRKVSPTGFVTTVAGRCGTKEANQGFQDGHATDAALFSSPSGITVLYDWTIYDGYTNATGNIILFVADTDRKSVV